MSHLKSKVVGLTTTHGNVDERQAFLNCQRFLSIAGRKDITIYRGSQMSLVNSSFLSTYFFGIDGIGEQMDHTYYDDVKVDNTLAALALIKLSKKYKKKLIVVTTGPVTNVALAVTLDPHFIDRLSQLYVVAGNIYGVKYPYPEFNAMMDVEAYHIVAAKAKPGKVTVIPFSSLMDSLNTTKLPPVRNDLREEELARNFTKWRKNVLGKWRKNVLGGIPTKIIKEMNKFERLSFHKDQYWALLACQAMALILNERLITDSGYSKNGVNLCGDKRGINTNNFNALDPNVRVVKGGDKELYKQYLVHLFSAELKKGIE